MKLHERALSNPLIREQSRRMLAEYRMAEGGRRGREKLALMPPPVPAGVPCSRCGRLGAVFTDRQGRAVCRVDWRKAWRQS